MKRMMTGLALLGAALLFAPAALMAQAPVELVCRDGTTQPGSSRVACGDHGGMDWDATRSWSEMRAGHYMASDRVVCTDGQTQAAAPRACGAHGGIDSVSTVAALHRRARAERFSHRNRNQAGINASNGDSAAGYRAMERSDSGTPGSSDSTESSMKPDSSSMSNPHADNPKEENGNNQPARADSAR